MVDTYMSKSQTYGQILVDEHFKAPNLLFMEYKITDNPYPITNVSTPTKDPSIKCPIQLNILSSPPANQPWQTYASQIPSCQGALFSTQAAVDTHIWETKSCILTHSNRQTESHL